jgi:tetratricopeptide (TPR) repeat protein
LHRLASTGRRGGDNNVVLRRGALLHADVAILGVAAPVEAMAFGTSSPGQSIRIRISDGRQTSLTQSSAHWEIARKLLDMVSAPGSSKAAPGSDEMVRLWYVATATWMEHQGQHDNRHLARGREIFSDDADLLFLTGAQHATYAGPPIQTAVRSAFLPTGIKIDVSSERAELRDAERYFRRAVDVRPEFAEAHLRLGRVLALTNRNADAARELGRALELTDEPLLVYYGTLFLGAVQETLGQNEAARAAYERAAALYPRAQSPRLALSELARRAGNRDVALREIEKVFKLRSDGQRDADPWWVYDMTQGRHAGALLNLLRKPFRSGVGP